MAVQVSLSDRLAELTPAQLQTLELMAEGLSNGEIAARRVVSTRTVEGNVNAIFTKLGLAQDSRLERRVTAVLFFRAASAERMGDVDADMLYSALAGASFTVEAARRTIGRDVAGADHLLLEALERLGSVLETVRRAA